MLLSARSSSMRTWLGRLAAAGAVSAVTACGGGAPETPAGGPPAAAPARPSAAQPDDALPPETIAAALPEGVRAIMSKPYTGDFDGMVARRLIRLGVAYNRSFYFVDNGVQHGAAYEYGRLFEDDLNERLRTGNAKVHVAFVPLSRDMLLTALLGGMVDAVVAQVTITPDKQKVVDFTIPTRKNVSEVVVTGPGAPKIATAADLSGQEVFVRKGSTYHQSLLALNDQLKAQNAAPVDVQFVPDTLEDDDLLEMVNAGLIPITVVDDYLAAFWKRIFTDLTVHDTVTVRTGGELAVAIRKNSPQLAAALNPFLAKHGIGSAFGNMMQNRYFASTKYAKNAASEAERKKFLAVVALFKKYSEQYGLDYLLMGAQGYQESGLNHGARSAVGAIGIMQVMPATGKDLKVGDITQVEANIHAGVKYMRFMMDQYFKDEPMDTLNKGLFTFASYNAGPGRVRQLRKEAEKRGLDPNVWFGNVEQIASERIGRETVTYVSNIYKYYIAYKLISEQNARREAAKKSMKSGVAK